MSSHRKLSVVLCPRKAHSMSVGKEACALAVLVLLLGSVALATECITPKSHATRYFSADLVVFGEVLSCTTRPVSKEDVPGDSGWVYHHVLSMREATVRVDSVLKGFFGDSTIFVHMESSQEWRRRRLDETTDTSDPAPVREMIQMAVSPGPGEVSEVPSSGSWILFLTERDSGFEFMWRADYNKLNLDLYSIFANVGDSVLELYDLSGWIMGEKDSMLRLQLKKK